jgi:hypothetical protein
MLPGLRRLDRNRHVQVIWQWVIDGLNFRISEYFREGTVRFRSSARAASSALVRSRDAIPTTSDNSPRCIAGMTFPVAILATARTPQRTFCISPMIFALGAAIVTRDGLSNVR